ncbi:MAG: hypothetical protein OEZ43_21805 [Gammaproteobacteria bacterium]|nr:hypothetical protein [Gammaproteobacteria bacterium]MDH5548215.1 hypothetical protein [Gammaproteobacteria bacterium]
MYFRIGFVLLLCGLLNSASAEIFQDSVESFKTGQGTVLKKQFGEPEDFGNRAVKIFLDDKLIYEEKDYPFVYLNGYFSVGDSTLIVISLTDGGNACPAFYKIIDVKNKNDIFITKEFGTCSDLIQANLDNDRLKITMPSMHPADPDGSWEYHGRQLVDKRKIGKNVSKKEEKKRYYNKDEVNTLAGKLMVVSEEKVNGDTEITIQLNTKKIFQEHQFKAGFIKFQYPMESSPQFVVIRFMEKNDGCDKRFRILEFSNKGLKHMSPEFGNCGAWPSFGYENGGIHVSFLKSSTKPYEEYLFKDGEIIQVK